MPLELRNGQVPQQADLQKLIVQFELRDRVVPKNFPRLHPDLQKVIGQLQKRNSIVFDEISQAAS